MRTNIAYFLLGAVFCAAILAGGIGSDAMVLVLAALSITLVVMAIGIRSPYRGFYALCFGEAPVLAVFPASFTAGLFAQLVLIALFLHSTGIFEYRSEFLWFFVYCVLVALGWMVLVSFEDPGLLLIASVGICGVLALGFLINEYRIGGKGTEGT